MPTFKNALSKNWKTTNMGSVRGLLLFNFSKMKIIMNYWAVGPDGNIEQKIQNWRNRRYRGDLLYGLTHLKKA